jgi:hypothetical protein
MTSTDFRAALATLGWSIRGLARMLGRPEGSVTNWTKPEYRVPPDVAAWLARRVVAHKLAMLTDPPPIAATPPWHTSTRGRNPWRKQA